MQDFDPNCGGDMDFQKNEWEASLYDTTPIQVPAGSAVLCGEFRFPGTVSAIVILTLGSGTGRFSPLNLAFSKLMAEAGYATLLLDLLTEEEELLGDGAGCFGCDPAELADRILGTVEWLRDEPVAKGKDIGLLASGLSAAPALLAGSEKHSSLDAIVACGLEPDSCTLMNKVLIPTLAVIGSTGPKVVSGRSFRAARPCPVKVRVIEGVNDLFCNFSVGKISIEHAKRWFGKHLRRL